MSRTHEACTYACHQFEYGCLGQFEELDDFVQTRPHRILIGIGSDHSAVQTVAERVINVKLRRRAGCEIGVVEAWVY